MQRGKSSWEMSHLKRDNVIISFPSTTKGLEEDLRMCPRRAGTNSVSFELDKMLSEKKDKVCSLWLLSKRNLWLKQECVDHEWKLSGIVPSGLHHQA